MDIDNKDYIIVFHGASNDKGENPDHKTIRAPSPEHPFFVSKDIDVAYFYINASTGSDGRIEEASSKDNRRVYVLRLNKSKLKAFNFFEENYLKKLKPFYSKGFIEYMIKRLVRDEDSLMDVTNRLAAVFSYHLESPDYIVELLNTAKVDTSRFLRLNSKEKIRLIDSILKARGDDPTTCVSSAEEAFLNLLPEIAQSNSKMSQIVSSALNGAKQSIRLNRRDIKAVLFEHVLELGYNAILEQNTTGTGNAWDISEIGLLTIDPIVDVVPFPVKIYILDRLMDKYSTSSDAFLQALLKNVGIPQK